MPRKHLHETSGVREKGRRQNIFIKAQLVVVLSRKNNNNLVTTHHLITPSLPFNGDNVFFLKASMGLCSNSSMGSEISDARGRTRKSIEMAPF